MHVCYIINQLAPGGAPTLLLDIVRNTTDPNISYTVCFVEGDDELTTEFKSEGVRVIDLGADFKFDPRALWRLMAFLREHDFDVLHAHLPYSQTLGRISGKLNGINHIVSTQHNVPSNYHPITRTLERVTRTLDSATIAVSEGVERQFHGEARRYSPPLDRQWCTIYNGIDVGQFRKQVENADPNQVRNRWDIDADLVFLNVARYVSAKAQHDLIDAMENVAKEIPDSHLFIVGWGKREAELRQQVHEQNLEAHVTITGRVPTVHEYYALADVFVSSSTFEGLPITHLEAMAAKLPLVATQIPGVSEVIADEETGLLVPPNQPKRLAMAMGRLADAGLQQSFRERGFSRVCSEFDIKQTVDSHLSLYRELKGL